MAAVLHVIFHLDTPLEISEDISDAAIVAAHDLVSVCIQHAAYLAGRTDVDNEIDTMIEGAHNCMCAPSVHHLILKCDVQC